RLRGRPRTTYTSEPWAGTAARPVILEMRTTVFEATVPAGIVSCTPPEETTPPAGEIDASLSVVAESLTVRVTFGWEEAPADETTMGSGPTGVSAATCTLT